MIMITSLAPYISDLHEKQLSYLICYLHNRGRMIVDTTNENYLHINICV